MNKIEEMKKLVKELNTASDAYYNGKSELMTDAEYDSKIELLEQLEKITGIVLSDSPCHRIGFQTLQELPEVEHTHLMLSQKKIHSIDEIISFAGDKDIYLSLKMDGLSLALSFDENGVLNRAETRGNGVKGTNVLHHLQQFLNTPNRITKGNYEIDGEAIIKTDAFLKYNQPLIEKATKEGKAKGLSGAELDKYIKDNSFANARNLASGTLNSLDNKLTKERGLCFVAWNVISGSDLDSYSERMKEASSYGFEIAPCVQMKQPISKEELENTLEWFKQIAEENHYPYDGVVIAYDSISYGKSLGNRDTTPRHSVAYKYSDDTYPTKLKEVEFTLGKTGVLTPTAIFEPVIIDGTTVERASLYNISSMKELGITNGCTCYVKKCNLIIPAVESCDNDGNGEIEIPSTCPVCGGETEIVHTENADILMCTNPNCSGKMLKKMSAFVSKQGMDINNLSDATLDVLLDKGYIETFKDIYHLDAHRSSLEALSGFGKKSVDKLLTAIEKSRKTDLAHFLTSLSIPLIGKSSAKLMMKKFGSIDFFKKYLYYFADNDMDDMELAKYKYTIDWTTVDGFDTKTHRAITHYFLENVDMVLELLEELDLSVPEEKQTISSNSVDLTGMIFVVTGSLNHFKNRSELQEKIESLGGKVVGSVSAKTSVLLNNDSESNSSKNIKAKSLNISIWTEDDFLKYIGE